MTCLSQLSFNLSDENSCYIRYNGVKRNCENKNSEQNTRFIDLNCYSLPSGTYFTRM